MVPTWLKKFQNGPAPFEIFLVPTWLRVPIWSGTLMTFTTGNIKGSDHCYIGNLGKISDWNKTHLTGCVGEIIGLHRKLMDETILYIHE